MVHASRYHEFLEDAFLHWLDHNDLPYGTLRGLGVDLVIGTATIRYRTPGRLGDRLVVTSHAARSTTSTLIIDFTIDRDDGTSIAAASVTYVALRAGTPAPLPAELAVYGEGALTAKALLARLHDAQAVFYGGGSSEPLEALLHPDVSWHVPGRSPLAGDYQGRAAVIAYMAHRSDLADRSFRMHAHELLVGPSHFAALTRGTAVIAGTSLEWETVGLYRSEDGQVRECFLIPFDLEAFDRVWSMAQGVVRD
jgi:YbgC/YbaW family acyl-CoA thioester hydrolase